MLISTCTLEETTATLLNYCRSHLNPYFHQVLQQFLSCKSPVLNSCSACCPLLPLTQCRPEAELSQGFSTRRAQVRGRNTLGFVFLRCKAWPAAEGEGNNSAWPCQQAEANGHMGERRWQWGWEWLADRDQETAQQGMHTTRSWTGSWWLS